jgi:hypothetical protein
MKIVCALVAIHSLSAFAQESWTDVGERNIATLRKLNEITMQLKGKQITPSLVAKLTQETLSFYAPTVSCSAGRGSNVDIHLTDVPVTDCWGPVSKIWRNTRVIDFDMHMMAIDPTSGGKTILAHMPYQAVGVTNAGQDVPGTNIRGVINQRYGFNHEGLLTRSDQEFDSGIVENMQKKVMMYENSVKWVDVGQKNIATLLHLTSIGKEMMLSKQMTPALLAKLADEMASYYAPEVSCSQSKGSSFAVHLTNVPVKACFMAISEHHSNNMKFTDFSVKKIAMDPDSGGKTILAYQPYQAVGVTNDGTEVPGTYVHGISSSRFDFNDEGKIMHYDQEFDSGIFESMVTKVQSYEKRNGMQINMDSEVVNQIRTASIAVLGLVFIAGVAGFFVMSWTRRHTRGPVLLEHSPIG